MVVRHLLKISCTTSRRTLHLGKLVDNSRPSNLYRCFSSISPPENRRLDYHDVFRHETHAKPQAAAERNTKSPWQVINVDANTKLLFFAASGQLLVPVRTPAPKYHSVTRCFGSSCFGWLIMGDTSKYSKYKPRSLFLFNPFTKQRLQLPYFDEDAEGVEKVILSRDPNNNKVVDVVLKSKVGGVYLCRLVDGNVLKSKGGGYWLTSADETPVTMDWSFLGSCHDIIFYKGVLYGVDEYEPRIFAIDNYYRVVEREEDRGMMVRRRCSFPRPQEKTKSSAMAYFLVESEGDLMVVASSIRYSYRKSLFHRNGKDPYCKKMDPNPRALYKAVSEACLFGVYKLDFETHSLVEVVSLGDDRMLLLDHACSVSLDASKFSAELGFKPNCIYYTNKGFYDDYGWNQFCLEDGKIEPFVGVDFSQIIPIPPLN